MLSEMKEFTDWVVAKAPYAPEFIAAISRSPTIFATVFDQYLTQAASSQWETSNKLAQAAPAMDGPLAHVVTDEQAFRFLAAIVHGAEWNGFGPMELANNSFNGLPKLKTKAQAFTAANAGPAAAILDEQNVNIAFASFVKKYLV